MSPGQKPNFLFLMADQLTAFALRMYGNGVCRTPNLDRLAARSTRYANMYCNFPLCAPSRVAMLSGRLPSAVGVYDNASEFSAEVPTFLHHLTLAGYNTILSGKMHFVGPEQHHGFQERLTTDIYPSDFGWTPDWREEIPIAPTGMNMRSVIEAGECRRSMQIDYDDEVVFRGVQKLYDLGRLHRDRPFFLAVSMTHPHNPYVSTRDFLELYRTEEIDMPRVGPIPFDQQDAHSQRLWYMFRQDEYDLDDAHVRTARHAYYAMVSYVDAQVGRLLDALRAMDLDESTVVVFTADHGDMLGERGLWYKWVHFEPAVRIPLLISVPGRRRAAVRHELVSLVDIFPTVLDLAGVHVPDDALPALDGRSLADGLGVQQNETTGVVYGEMNGEGAHAPCLMLRKAWWKLIVADSDAPQLFDLQNDPHEQCNLAGKPEVREVERQLVALAGQKWDATGLHQAILQSQARRRLIQQTRLTGDFPAWDFQPFTDASRQYVRAGAQSSPSVVKGKLRYPPVEPVAPQRPRAPTTSRAIK
ncbi:choline-sulfatase [Bordetella sp. 15P40C-2]|uniref:choline-sulfatase n=1 Tax=Bordetella sp. 15P40C-2 TaxID=2572246 RepID=UPI0013208661|nr:choline-sulfatase [Bordetella sp. 15P40C-2]MVW71828.1 choline-sulfatase [Bordetella sp. 15P40C-2]